MAPSASAGCRGEWSGGHLKSRAFPGSKVLSSPKRLAGANPARHEIRGQRGTDRLRPAAAHRRPLGAPLTAMFKSPLPHGFSPVAQMRARTCASHPTTYALQRRWAERGPPRPFVTHGAGSRLAHSHRAHLSRATSGAASLTPNDRRSAARVLMDEGWVHSNGAPEAGDKVRPLARLPAPTKCHRSPPPPKMTKERRRDRRMHFVCYVTIDPDARDESVECFQEMA
jgi:hypothetical protein